MRISAGDKLRFLLALVALGSSLKLLLIPTYHSTDFEVHRNWMAITYSLPIKQWYFERTSEWTLDYPPFFAYFEWILSQIAQLCDRNMLQVDNLNYASDATVLFQRLSVIATDVVLAVFAWKLLCPSQLSARPSGDRKEAVEEAFPLGLRRLVLVVLNAGLLFVDHIHFQYNGVLIGLLVGSIYWSWRGNHPAVTFAFSLLVLMKHLFAPLALVFAVVLLVAAARQGLTKGFVQLSKLAYIALVCIGLAFGPFILQRDGVEQMQQIFSRLFPFGRGLVHAYWAPNVWALYCFADKVGAFLFRKVLRMQFEVDASAGFNSSSGLVGEYAMVFLPKISAAHCIALVLVAMIPALIAVYRNQSTKILVRALSYASLCNFVFGYHVHEKAIIIPWILQLIYAESALDRFSFMLLSTTGLVSLFPLIPGRFEQLIKAAFLIVSVALNGVLLDAFALPQYLKRSLFCSFGALLITVSYYEVIHRQLFSDHDGDISLPFLPLLLVSVVCATFIFICWCIEFVQLITICRS